MFLQVGGCWFMAAAGAVGTIDLSVCVPEKLRPDAMDVIREAKTRAFGSTVVNFVHDPSAALVLDNDFLIGYPLAEEILVQRLLTMNIHPFGPETLYLDIETHSAELMWDMPLDEYFRLGQWAVGDGDVNTTTDHEVILDLINRAPGVVAHAGHSFDFLVLLGREALTLAMDNRLLDTKVHANLAVPAPRVYNQRGGRKRVDAASPDNAKHGWLSLDNLCFQLGVPGKFGSLTPLAKKFGGYGNIPQDDPLFLQYAVQDVEALRSLTGALLRQYPMNEYSWREQLTAAMDAQMSLSGFTVDIEAATARRDFLEGRKNSLMKTLVESYGFPTDGAKPWMSKQGKQAILSILADYGITEDQLPRTNSGSPSFGGEGLVAVTAGTDAQEVGQALAELMGQRSLSQLTLDSVRKDGKVHPEIMSLQRSGRKSVTNPGLTVFDKKEKNYYVASPGRKLVSYDLSNADARIIAALSGDPEYAKRMEPGVDSHEITGRAAFGSETYDSDPGKYRKLSKPMTHGWSYGGGPSKLASAAGIPYENAKRFVDGMKAMYPRLAAWQDRVRAAGESGFITNDWGRRMLVDKGKSYTQSPALLGQSGTREILVDAMIKMLKRDRRLIEWLVLQVHDELIADIPVEHLDWADQAYRECLSTYWGSGQIIKFEESHSDPVDNWALADH